MDVRAALVLVCGLGAAAAASCGEQFTLSNGAGGTGGAGGTKGASSTTSALSDAVASSTGSTSSSSSTGSTSSSSSASSSSGLPPNACSVASPDCGTDAYCFVQSCGKGDGTCVKLSGISKDELDPLCGCNGDTYWSGVEASAHMQAVGETGECTATTAKTCGPNAPCADGSPCSMEVSACGEAKPEGKCWVLPDCALHTDGAHACTGISLVDAGATCDSICKMISMGTVWVRDPPCTAL